MDIDSGEWVTACTTNTPSATAQGLKPGHLYMFEISAINKEGQSEPLFTGDPILAENPYSEYRYNIIPVELCQSHVLLFLLRTAKPARRAQDC